MVRLLHMYQRVNNLRKLSFNPTMVRLLPSSSQRSRPLGKFQSHNGAIAAPFIQSFFTRVSRFQSHNGAIAAARLPKLDWQQIRFNPTMVRLLPFPKFAD